MSLINKSVLQEYQAISEDINTILTKEKISYEIFEQITYNLLITRIPNKSTVKIIKEDPYSSFKKVLKEGQGWDSNNYGFRNQKEFNLIKSLFYYIFSHKVIYNLMFLSEYKNAKKFLLGVLLENKIKNKEDTDYILHWFIFDLYPRYQIEKNIKNILDIELTFSPTFLIPKISLVDLIQNDGVDDTEREANKLFAFRNDFKECIYPVKTLSTMKFEYETYLKEKILGENNIPVKIVSESNYVIGNYCQKRDVKFLEYFPDYICWRFNMSFNDFQKVNSLMLKQELQELQCVQLKAFLKNKENLRFSMFKNKKAILMIFEFNLNNYWNIMGTIVFNTNLKTIEFERREINFVDKDKKLCQYPLIKDLCFINKHPRDQTLEEINQVFQNKIYYLKTCTYT